MKLFTALPKVEKVEFALFCAKKCIHLVPNVALALNCIKATEYWLKDPCSYTEDLCRKAHHDTHGFVGRTISVNRLNNIDSVNDYVRAFTVIMYTPYTVYSVHSTHAVFWTTKVFNASVGFLYNEWISEKVWKLMEA